MDKQTTVRRKIYRLIWAMFISICSLLLSASKVSAGTIDEVKILSCAANFGSDFKITFSDANWVGAVEKITVGGKEYTKTSYSSGVWNNTNYYTDADSRYILIGENFDGPEAECVMEAQGYDTLRLLLNKSEHTAEIKKNEEKDPDTEDPNTEKPDGNSQKPNSEKNVTPPSFHNETGFYNYYVLTFTDSDYVKGITEVLVNGEKAEESSYSTYLHGTQYYKNEADNKLYLANSKTTAADILLKNNDLITIRSAGFQEIVLRVKIVGSQASIEIDDGQEESSTLHIRLVGSFESALVNQTGYDAVSGASSSVTTNKNSNAEVQGALLQNSDTPDEDDWVLLKDLDLTIDAAHTSVEITPDGCGMVGVYSTYDSSITLAGTPAKAGNYEIRVKITDSQGRSAQSNVLPFIVYSGSEALEDCLTLENSRQTADGKYMYDMEPWSIYKFGGTNETVTVPKDLKAWYGSHTSGTYGKLGYAIEEHKETTQTLIVPKDCNLTLVNMDILSSVRILVEEGGKLTLRDSVVQGLVEVENGGAFSMNYDDYSGSFESGASINGQLVLKDGAKLMSSSIYSNSNNIANGNQARHTTKPVVVAQGNVTVDGTVFIRGDEAATGTDETTGKSYAGQAGLSVEKGVLTLTDGSLLAVFAGGQNATTSVGGTAVYLADGTITGDGKLIAIGGDGEYNDGGHAVSGTGTISVKEAFLQGGSTFMPVPSASAGKAKNQNVSIAENVKTVLIDGIAYTKVEDDPKTPHWKGTQVMTPTELEANYSMEKESQISQPGKIENTTLLKENFCSMDIGNTEEELMRMLPLTQEEEELIKNGKNISIKLFSKAIMKNEIQKSEWEAAEKLLSSDEKIGKLLDLTLQKVVDGTEKEVTQTQERLTITLVIPEEIRNAGTNPFIIRVHEGKAERLELKQSDEHYSFETDRFSTYAIAYKVQIAGTGETPQTKAPVQTNVTLSQTLTKNEPPESTSLQAESPVSTTPIKTAPATGDFALTKLWTVSLLITAGLFLSLSLFVKRKNRQK